MRGDEARVVEAFRRYLQKDGWDVQREVQFVDVKATKGSLTLYAEAKGRTTAIGLDVDTLYGQLLRRVPDEASSSLLGVVVPDAAIDSALRVPEWIRNRLRVHIWAVSDDVAFEWCGDPSSSRHVHSRGVRHIGARDRSLRTVRRKTNDDWRSQQHCWHSAATVPQGIVK